MTIVEYVEYEKEMSENHISNTKTYLLTYFSKCAPTHDSIQEFAHYFGPNQPGVKSNYDSEDMEEEVEYMTNDEVFMSEQEKSNHRNTQNIQHFKEKDDVDKWLNAEITKHLTNIDNETSSIDNSEVDTGDDNTPPTTSCLLPKEELLEQEENEQLPIRPRPYNYSFEEWLKIRIGHNNLHESDREFIFNEWILNSYDVEEEYAREISYPYSRRFDEYNRVFKNEIEHLSNEYILRIGKKGYVLDDVWEKCQQNYKKINEAWNDKAYEEEKMCFICITNRKNEALPLGRVNEACFKAMIRKELDGNKYVHENPEAKRQFSIPARHIIIGNLAEITAVTAQPL
ncbi:hypothetical protein Tco_0985827, partial [Tanacetum coccineum]